MSDESWLSRTAAGPDQLSPADFQRIATLVTERTGIKLPVGKRLMLDGRIRRRARAAGFESIATYCDHILRGPGLRDELPHLIDAATTNKTDFFREPEHFRLVEKRIVPEAVSRRRTAGTQPLLKFWSAACSNGAEVYTLAMVLADMAMARRDFSWSVLGTDISRAMLSTALNGVYPAEMIEPVPAGMQHRYVMEGRARDLWSKVRIVPEIRKRVAFEFVNLMDASYPTEGDWDAIFLRNVLIYFDKADQEAVVTRLCGHLRPGGYLLLGHAESMIGLSLGLRQVAPASFQVP